MKVPARQGAPQPLTSLLGAQLVCIQCVCQGTDNSDVSLGIHLLLLHSFAN